MDNSGSLNAQVIHQLGPGLRSKMAIQVSGRRVGCPPAPRAQAGLTPCSPQTQQSKFVNWQVDGEYRGSDFTAAVTLGNPDVLVGSGKRAGPEVGHLAIPAVHAHPLLPGTPVLSEKGQARNGFETSGNMTS